MKFILITDYAYHTLKTFFNEEQPQHPDKGKLNSRIYELASYKKNEHGINYSVNLSTVRYL